MINSPIMELTSKDIKKLNEFNQIVKRVFNGIYIFSDGIIMTDPEIGNRVNKGVHFATTSIQPIDNIPSNYYMSLKCDKIFKFIRDNKKNIRYLTIDGGDLYIDLKDESKEIIGRIFDADDNLYLKKRAISNTIEYHKTHSSLVSQNVIESLSDNEIYTYGDDEYRVRITKELLPALKRDMKVNISFRDEVGDPTLFYIILSVDKGDVITYHMYKCIKY